MIRTLFMLLGLGTVGLMVLIHGGQAVIDSVTFVVVVVSPILLTAGFHGPEQLGAALRAAESETAVAADAYKKHQEVLGSLRALLWASGGLGFLIGSVHILASFEGYSIGNSAAVGVALLTGMYVFIVAELVVAPLTGRMLVRVQDGRPGVTSPAFATKSEGSRP